MPIDLQAMLRHAGELQRETSLGELVQVAYVAVKAHTRYAHAHLAVVDRDDPRFMYVVEVRGTNERLVLDTCPRLTVADDAMVRELLEGGAPVVIPEAAEDRRTDKRIVEILKNRTLGRSASPSRQVDLNASVSSTLRLVRSSIPRGVNVRHEEGPTPPVIGDPVQIDQALANLLINARDAVGDTGEIVIAVSARELDDTLVRNHSWARSGHFGRVSVQDDGPGIPSELLERIYDPLFTTKKTGTGLGLAVVSRVVQQHSRLLHVESGPGQGSTFELYLPMRPG